MAFLTKKQILSADDRPIKVISVPEWGGEVGVRAMSGHARLDFEQSALDESGDAKENLIEKMIAASLCDEDGKLIFAQKDIKQLSEKSTKALMRVFKECQTVNAVSDEDIEELAKN